MSQKDMYRLKRDTGKLENKMVRIKTKKADSTKTESVKSDRQVAYAQLPRQMERKNLKTKMEDDINRVEGPPGFLTKKYRDSQKTKKVIEAAFKKR